MFWLLLLALCSLAAGPPTLRSGHSLPLRLSAGQIERLAGEQAGPEVAALAAALADRRSNTVLWSRDAHSPLPMASTTKLMTALLAQESLPADETLTVPEAALIGNASMGLEAGDEVRVRTLLYGALLPSGNDAAMTLAIRTAGSEAAFVQAMNERAALWGLSQTHFANPHGLDAPGHVSSALDLLELGRRTLDQPLLAQIVGTRQIVLEGYALQNTNELLGLYEGAYGVKTGTTDLAGQVLIAAAARPGGDALAVLLGSPDRYADARHLLDYYFAHWRWLDARLRADALNRLITPAGAIYALRTPSMPLFLESWQAMQLHLYRNIVFAADGAPAGVLQVWLGEEKLAEAPIEFLLQTPAGAGP